MCAAEDWSEDGLFQSVRRAYPYRDLLAKTLTKFIDMLSEGIASVGTLRGLSTSRSCERHGPRPPWQPPGSHHSGGAIPENSLYTVVAHPEAIVVGTVDEDFAVESLAGDIMLLGNTSWRIRRVKPAAFWWKTRKEHQPNVPFLAWRGAIANRRTLCPRRRTARKN